MIKLVAFDWNGTILDDIEPGTKAESAVRVHYGFKETNIDEIREHFIIPIKQFWVNAGLGPEFFDTHADEIEKIYMEHYEPGENTSPLRVGTKELLDWLAKENIESIIFSNHIIPHIEEQTKRLGVYSYFKKILARPVKSDTTHLKKLFKDQLLNEYVSNNEFLPEEIIVIGDTIEEIEIGQKFGYKAVAVTEGWQSKERLQKAAPDYLINNLIELKEIINKLNGRIT
jgi:phosphoglycolate phosphatase